MWIHEARKLVEEVANLKHPISVQKVAALKEQAAKALAIANQEAETARASLQYTRQRFDKWQAERDAFHTAVAEWRKLPWYKRIFRAAPKPSWS